MSIMYSVCFLLQLQFVAPSAEEFDFLQRQMKARLGDGQGETIYEIGLGGAVYLYIYTQSIVNHIHTVA